MIDLHSSRVFLFLVPTDMRKSYDTLAAIVKQNGMDARCGDLFVFTNRRRTRFKILIFETGGYWLLAKRLEEGIFAVPIMEDQAGNNYPFEIDLTELRLLIHGYEIKNMKKNKRYA